MNQDFTASKQREFTYGLVVTQGDITPYGSASFINYVRWYGIARDALLQWRNLGFDDSLKTMVETDISFCNVQYKREAMLQDEIIIKVNSCDVKDHEFTLLFTLIRKSDALIISLGKQTINFYNSKTGEKISLQTKLIENVLKPIEVDENTLLFKY